MEDAANGIPLEQCRGIEHIDLNDYLVLVRAPIERVAQAFSQLRQVGLWERDVYEREIEILGHGFIVFQFRGHPWTLIHELNFLPYQVPLEDKDVKSLSNLLHTKAIYYHISDTGGNLGYHLYDCGESIEKLYFTYDREGKMDEDENENEDIEEQGTCHFQSQHRQLKADDIENVYSFTDAFFREQDVYVPALFWGNFRVGQQITLRLQSFEHDDFERMDYLIMN